MAMDANTRGQPDGAGSNLTNLISYACQSIIKGMVSTAIPVRVDKVESSGDGAGFVSATPLVTPRDNDGNSLGSVSIPKLPYFRYYSGRCAIVCDPVAGDIGLAVFAQQDCSLVSREIKEPTIAGSFRNYDMADGFYIGGFYKGEADTEIVLGQDGTIKINTPVSVMIDSPSVHMTGTLEVDGNISTKQDVTANGLSLLTHVHGNVQNGKGKTGAAE